MLTEAMEATVFRCLDDASLANAWRGLDQEVRSSPFATHWWASAQAAGTPSPVVVAIARAGRPVAVAAFSLVAGRLMTAAGAFRDYSDWLCAEDDRAACAAAIARALPWKEIRRIRISGIQGSDPLGEALHAEARRHGLFGWLGQIDQAPKLSLVGPDGRRFDSYRFVFKSKNSKRLKIALEKKGAVEFWKARCLDDIGPAVDRLAALHIRRWAPTFTPSGYAIPARRETLRRIAENALAAGCLHFCELHLDGRPISSSMGYVTGNTYGFHAVAFDAGVAGNSTIRSHLAYLLDDLAETTRVTRFDFLSGGEEYKLAVATGTESLRILDVGRNPVAGLVAYAKGAAFEAIYRRPDWYARAKYAKRSIRKFQHKLTVPVEDFRRIAREFGLGRAVANAIRTVRSRFYDDTAMTVSSLPLNPGPALAAGATNDYIEIAPGTFLDYAELVHRRMGDSRSGAVLAFDERTAAGMHLFVVRERGRIVGGGWLQVGGRYAPSEVAGREAVAADAGRDGYVIDVWTAPACRGRRLLSRLLAHMVVHARELGLNGQLHAAIDLRNTASRRGFAKFGFVEGQTLGLRRHAGSEDCLTGAQNKSCSSIDLDRARSNKRTSKPFCGGIP